MSESILTSVAQHRQDGTGDPAQLLRELLEHLRLAKFADALHDLGVEGIDDIKYLLQSDLEVVGMPPISRRKLFDAVGVSWHQSARAGGVSEETVSTRTRFSTDGDTQFCPVDKARDKSEKDICAAKGGDSVASTETGGNDADNVQITGVSDGTLAWKAPEDPHQGAESVRSESREKCAPEDITELQVMEQSILFFVENFMDANSLDPFTQAQREKDQLLRLPPRITLRAIGVLGTGNAFVMHRVRNPGGAVMARARAALAEEQQNSKAAAAAMPYEEWGRLLDDFAKVNRALDSTHVMKPLQKLTREQALHVMGFTSQLCFRIPRIGGMNDVGAQAEVEVEIQARIHTALSAESLFGSNWLRPVIPLRCLSPKAPDLALADHKQPQSGQILACNTDLPQPHVIAAGALRGVTGSTAPPVGAHVSSPGNSHSGAARGPNATQPVVGGKVGTRAGVGSPSHRGGSRSRSRGRDIRKRSYSRSRSRSLSNSLSRSCSSGSDNEKTRRSSLKPPDVFIQWRRAVENFGVVNGLTDWCTQALANRSKEQALFVMGLVGIENSFVIKGARNPTAAVMKRISSAHERVVALACGEAPYAQVPRLIADFCAVNRLPVPCRDALRSAPAQEALHVMGFDADNSFMIRGVHNAEAAIWSRLKDAKRACRDMR